MCALHFALGVLPLRLGAESPAVLRPHCAGDCLGSRVVCSCCQSLTLQAQTGRRSRCDGTLASRVYKQHDAERLHLRLSSYSHQASAALQQLTGGGEGGPWRLSLPADFHSVDPDELEGQRRGARHLLYRSVYEVDV